jgi:hypothetical protein
LTGTREFHGSLSVEGLVYYGSSKYSVILNINASPHLAAPPSGYGRKETIYVVSTRVVEFIVLILNSQPSNPQTTTRRVVSCRVQTRIIHWKELRG